ETTLAAPSRLAAITAHSPTAPSPTTTTLLPAVTPADTAAWCPVPMTSDSVSSPGIWSSRGIPGVATSVPSAFGTRTRSPWAPSASEPDWSGDPHHPPLMHDVLTPLRQLMQLLS